MSKRFTCTDKWEDTWFSDLSSDMKLAWMYILDRCDHAGIWKRNFKNLRFHCHSEKTDDEITEIFSCRIIPFDNDKWFIPKFLKFQYPNGLNSNKPAIVGVRKRLIEADLLLIVKEWLGNDYLIINNDKPIIKDKDKDMVKDMVKDMDIVKDISKKKSIFIPPTLEEIKDYISKNNMSVNPDTFFKYFEAGNWVDSKGSRVKNWKQKIITWEGRNGHRNKVNSGKQSATPETEYEETKYGEADHIINID